MTERAGSSPTTDTSPSLTLTGRLALVCLFALAGVLPLIDASNPFLPVKHMVYLGLALFGALCLWGESLQRKTVPAIGTPVDKAFGVFLLTSIPALLVARNPGMARYDLGLVLALGLTYLLATKTLRQPQQVRLLFLFVLLAAVVISILGLNAYSRFITDGAEERQRSAYLATHLFAHSYLAAQYLVMVFTGGVVLLLHRGLRTIPAVLTGLALVPIGAYLFVIGSRGAYLAVMVALTTALVFAATASRHRVQEVIRLVLRAGLLAAAAIILVILLGEEGGAASYALERILLVFDPENSDFNFSRLAVWKHSLEMAADHFLFGVGGGSFDTVLPSYHWSPKPIPHAHNQFLDILSTRGLLGLAAFLFLLREAVRAARRGTAHLIADDERRPLFHATVAALAAIGIYFIFETPIVWPEAGSLLVILLATLSRAGCTDRDRPARPLIAHAGAAAVLACLWTASPVWLAYGETARPALAAFEAAFKARASMAIGDKDKAQTLYASAISNAQEADQLFPYRSDFPRLQADALFDMGRYDEALASNTLALARQPGTFTHLNAIGKLHMKLGNYDQAATFLRRAILAHRAVGSEGTYFSLGKAYLYSERYEEAWIVLSDLIEQYHYQFEQPAVLLDAAETLIHLDRNLLFLTLLLDWYEAQVPETADRDRRLKDLRRQEAGLSQRPKRTPRR